MISHSMIMRNTDMQKIWEALVDLVFENQDLYNKHFSIFNLLADMKDCELF